MTKEVCYLCGEPDPDTRDHVPPKCILSGSNAQRLTIPAHRACNTAFSKDEEYFRDLVGPTGLDFPGGDDIYWTTKKAWQRPQGQRRLRMIMRDARPVQLQSRAGLYLGKAIGVRPDLERVTRVGFKIARGVIYHDTQAVADPNAFNCVHIHSRDVPTERERELEKNNPFWLTLSWEKAYHDNFAESVAVRRAYTPVAAQPCLACMCFMLVMVYGASFVVIGNLALPKPPKGFIMVGLPGITHEAAPDNAT